MDYTEVRYYIWKKWFNFTLPIRRIRTGICNIIRWLPYVWADRQWDFGFLEDILKFKLKMMEDFFYSDKVHIEDAKEMADQIKECRQMLEKAHGNDFKTFDEEYEMRKKAYTFMGEHIGGWWD